MENRLALVIVIDGLRASALGTYGNTSYPTPRLDELASRSLVAEWLLADSPTLEGFYGSVWNSNAEVSHFLPRLLREQGVRQWLITDDTVVSDFANDNSFDEIVLLDPGEDQEAQEISETHTVRFFAEAVEQLIAWQKASKESEAGGLLWVHFSGLCGPWDAPVEFCRELIDDEDLLSEKIVVPPSSIQVDDVDEIFGYRTAYAAQVALLDSCVTGFLETFDATFANVPRLTALTSSRGFSLGEHGSVGKACDGARSEQVHLPWLTSSSVVDEPLPRVGGFARIADASATLSEWLIPSTAETLSVGESLVPCFSGEQVHLRDVAIAVGHNGDRSIRTPAWQMHVGQSVQLYAKPDDQWEANDVASRCPEVVQSLTELLDAYSANAKVGMTVSQAPLADHLVSLWR